MPRLTRMERRPTVEPMTTASVLPPSPPTLPAPPGAVPRRSVRISSPGQVAGAVAQLAALGAIGPGVFGGLFGLLGAGVGLLFAVLIGAVLLAGLVYALFGVAWFEQARLEGLYGFDLPALRPRRSPKSGFVGVLHTIWLQAIDLRQWRAVASFTVATVLGLVTLLLVGAVAWGLALVISPLFGWAHAALFGLFRLEGVGAPLVGGLVALVATAALTALLLAPLREALLEEQARTSDTRRAGAVRAAEVERTRIERDLHDGVQPRLVSIGMTLGLAQTKIDDDPEAAKALVAEAHASTKSAITELRQLARGIHASVLEDRGLDAALSALASRSHIPVTLDVRLPRRCSRPAEAAVYFSIAEALTNAAKHSRAANCRVDVRVRDDGSLWARVEDDGLGGARVVPGGGLDGIVNRVTAAGGTARIASPQGRPRWR